MPKLTKEEIKKAQYTSMAKLFAQLDQIADFDEKVKFATISLLSHGMNGQKTDYTFEEAIHLARVKLADESKRLKDKIAKEEELDSDGRYSDQNPNAVNPYAKEEKDDIENQFFMSNPCEYLQSKVDEYVKDIKDQDLEKGEELAFKKNCLRLSENLTSQKSRQILAEEEKGMNCLNIQARLEAKSHGRDNFKKLEKVTRPNWFTRTFTRSKAGKNFDEAYAAFNNPKHPNYGNMDILAKASQEYADYKYSKKSAAERIAGLAVKEPKEGLALRILDSIKEQKESEQTFKSVVNDAAKKNLTIASVDQIKGPAPEEAEHKIPLILDLDEDNENDLDDSLESESELEIQNEAEKEQKLAA